MNARKAALFAIAATLVLAAIPAGVGTALGASRPTAGTDITFDGYCDGMHLEVPSVGLGTDSTVDGYQTGCLADGVFGQAKPNRFGVYGVTKGTEYVTAPGISTFTVVNRNHTWTHYGFNGNQIYLLNSGTWSLGAPAAARQGLRSSYTSSAVRAARPARISSVKEISFDGYCDGMHLVSPSVGLGVKPTVDGNRTGCATEGLIGSKTKILNQGGTYVVTFNTGGLWIQTAVFKNHTWIHYAISGNSEYVFNSGTWSLGPPAARVGGHSSV
jgi:hypothetical protein